MVHVIGGEAMILRLEARSLAESWCTVFNVCLYHLQFLSTADQLIIV
jgi:hypothetical protein